MQYTGIPIHFPGSPSCPTVNTTVNAVSLTVSIQKSPMMWLPEWYYAEVSTYFNGSIAEVYNSTLKGAAPFDLTPLQPGTVYNISVIPCNMAGCNWSCDIHSVQTGFDTGMGGEMYGMRTYKQHYYNCRTCEACFSSYGNENIVFLFCSWTLH